MTFERIHGHGLSILLALLLTACGSGQSSRDPGITVDFNLEIPAGGAPAGSKPLAFRNTEGVDIVLEQAWVVLWSQTLTADCGGPEFVRLPGRWLDWWISSAQAHAGSDPRVQPVPHAIELVAESGTRRALGAIHPPPGIYCGVRVDLRRADSDTVGLPENPPLLERSVFLQGRYRTNAMQAPAPFVFETGRTLIPAQRLFPTPLTLSADQPHARVTLRIRYDRWFDGVELSRLDDPTQQDLLLYNISASVELAGVAR